VENLRKAEELLDPIVATDPRDRYAIYLSATRRTIAQPPLMLEASRSK
jgi:hypothetical protein